jgi:hypothetical protein
LQKGLEGILWYPTRGNLCQSKTYDLGLTFIKACSDLWAIHQRMYKEWQKGGFYSLLASDEITTPGYRVLTSVECTTIMIDELAITSGLGSSFD